MHVGSNRCPYLKFLAHVPLFLSAKICESRVLTLKNKRREYETIYSLLLLIKCISTSFLYILVYLSKICYSIIVACLILYSLGSDKQPFPLLTFGEHQSVPVE